MFVLILSVLLAAQSTQQGGASLAGIVRDANGHPIEGVTVTLLAESGSARTDSAGRFVLRGLVAGGHTALFRRLGLQSIEYRWAARDGREQQISVTLRQLPRQLEAVVSEAPGLRRRHGASSISGTVLGPDNRGVAGADVRLLGAGLSTIADSAGGFAFSSLPKGSYLLRARHRGLGSNTVAMQLADSDSRGTSVRLRELPAPQTSDDEPSGYGAVDTPFEEFDRRVRDSGGELLGPADLFRAAGASLDVVLGRYQETRSRSEENACLLLNGRRAVYQPLGSFSANSVSLVEIVRPHDVDDGFVGTRMESVPACRDRSGKHPLYFVLWTRSIQ